ncbi:MAG: integration host factor subunit beta [Phycisphaerae bacterium]|nr:integration host factor subunit beta [Phycisphaerae bacterium]
MATVTKKELIDRITDELNRTRPRAQIKGVQVKRVVQKFLDMIIEELAKGNRLEFRDFGVFESKLRAERVAQNPKTLERVHVPPKRSVKFKVGRLMKEKLLRASAEEGGSEQLEMSPSGQGSSGQ